MKLDFNAKIIAAMLVVAVIIFGHTIYDFASKVNVTKEESLPIAIAPGNAEVVKAEPVIYVSGAVNKPGVFKVPPGSRVIDAVNAAGGFTARADSERINLAQLVKDGQHINVLSQRPPDGAQSGNSAVGGNSSTALININTATEKELQELPGIGPALAKRIIDFRANNGPFAEISELRRVAGIGEVRFNQLEPLITL